MGGFQKNSKLLAFFEGKQLINFITDLLYYFCLHCDRFSHKRFLLGYTERNHQLDLDKMTLLLNFIGSKNYFRQSRN